MLSPSKGAMIMGTHVFGLDSEEPMETKKSKKITTFGVSRAFRCRKRSSCLGLSQCVWRRVLIITTSLAILTANFSLSKQCGCCYCIRSWYRYIGPQRPRILELYMNGLKTRVWREIFAAVAGAVWDSAVWEQFGRSIRRNW